MIKENTNQKNTVFSVQEIKNRLTPLFLNYGIKKAVLFGSCVKNTSVAESDVDLLVDSGLKGLSFVGFIELVKEALAGKDVDVFDAKHIIKNSRMDKEIKETGIEIYAQ